MLILQWLNCKSPCFRIPSPYCVYLLLVIWHDFHGLKYFAMEQGNQEEEIKPTRTMPTDHHLLIAGTLIFKCSFPSLFHANTSQGYSLCLPTFTTFFPPCILSPTFSVWSLLGKIDITALMQFALFQVIISCQISEKHSKSAAFNTFNPEHF